MKKSALLAVLLVVFLSAGNGLADPIPVYVGQTVTVGQGSFPRGNDGGPFLVTGPVPATGTPFSFFTFCVEKDEYLSLGSNYYVADISTTVIAGGLDNPPNSGNPGNPNPPPGLNALSYEAAALYNLWLADSAKNDSVRNAAYQDAIWFAEGELNSLAAGSLALTLYGSVSGANSYGGVYVLNLTDANGAFQQSLLVKDPVPEPATMMLIGFGLIGLAAFGRKKLV